MRVDFEGPIVAERGYRRFVSSLPDVPRDVFLRMEGANSQLSMRIRFGAMHRRVGHGD
jgi:hypothetical protein